MWGLIAPTGSMKLLRTSMKIFKMRNFGIIALLSLLALVGCNHSTPIEPMDELREIGFAGYARQINRSLVENLEDLQEQELKLYGSYTLDGNTARLFDAERLFYDSTLPGWDYTTTQYWMMGASYHFYSLSPYTTYCTFSETQNAVTILDYESSTDSEDLLYATASRDLSVAADFSAVMFQFRHACAAVQFNLVNASNSVLTDVRNIRLVGLYNKGNFRFAADGSAAWTLNTSTTIQPNADVQPFAGVCILPEGGLPVNLTVEHPLYENGAILVLPQSIYKSSVTLHLEYKKAGDSEYAIRDIQLGMLGGVTPTEWKAGELYKYKLNITDNTITAEVTVVDWVDDYVDL